MAWYRTGSVAVTNNNAVVNGTGTSWVANVKAGDAFRGPDKVQYEILSVNSDTQLTLAENYGGSTASGQSYAISPTTDYARSQAGSLATFISTYAGYQQTVLAGKFGDGNAASPGISWASNPNTGFYRAAANIIGIVAAGVERGRFTQYGIQYGTAASYATPFTSTPPLLTLASGGSKAVAVLRGAATADSGATGILALQRTAAASADTLTATASGDTLGLVEVSGVNGSSNLAAAAHIQFLQDGAGGTGYVPGAIVFKTASNSTTVEAGRFNSARELLLGHTLAGHGRLSVSAGRSANNGSATTADSTMVVDKYLGAVTDAATGYVALCEKYTTGNVAASGFDGLISMYRGSTPSSNVLERVRVCIKTAYQSNILQELAGNRGLVEFDYAGTTYIGINLGVGASRDIYAAGRFWKFSPFLVQDAQASNVTVVHSASEFRALGSTALVIVAGGTAATFDANRNLLVGVSTAIGDAKIQVSNGVRIDTATVSADANTLDYYEEGTFTPTVVGATTAGAGTYSGQLGRYTRVGNRVHFTIQLIWTAHTGAGEMGVSGLPFTSSSVSNNVWACAVRADNLTYSGQLTAVIGGASTQVVFRQMSSGASAAGLTLDTAAMLQITGTYEV